MQGNEGWEEFTHHIDRYIHDYGKYMVPIFIFFAMLIFLGIGYLATHKFPGTENKNVIQEVSQ